jgi:hypothetical protein
MPRPTPTPIFHLTHGKNLKSIIEQGGLWCHRELETRQLASSDIAYAGIQSRRARWPVPCTQGGYLHDYVPFYFCPRSPMLLALKQGRVEGFTGPQRALVYLVSTVETVNAARISTVFTDGHAAMMFTDFYDDTADLDKLDWQVIQSNSWADTDDDPDRKRRKQSEFLVYGFIPLNLLNEIGVHDEGVANRVRELLEPATHQPVVSVQRRWYY